MKRLVKMTPQRKLRNLPADKKGRHPPSGDKRGRHLLKLKKEADIIFKLTKEADILLQVTKEKSSSLQKRNPHAYKREILMLSNEADRIPKLTIRNSS